ncbi:MAG: exodeoxyribonuclease VII small subunit [Myxococcales bacterium]|nr:exodeoxyribonuclease VII small subunit [Myxococcales bacterium]
MQTVDRRSADNTPMKDTPAEDLSYSDAVRELEDILAKIEDAEIDVDQLSDHVGRAAQLLKLCRQRIGRAEMQVRDVLKDMEEDDPWTSGAQSEN